MQNFTNTSSGKRRAFGPASNKADRMIFEFKNDIPIEMIRGIKPTFIWSNEYSLQDILRRVASLPSHSAIVYLTFGTDAQGGAYADEQVLADVHAKSNAPMFGVHSTYFGHGTDGGSMLAVSDLARNTADVASRILNGEPPTSRKMPPQLQGQPRFDWRELQRWGISESRLPRGAEILYRSPSIWDTYRWHIAGIVALLILQASMITGLVLQRNRQQRADSELQRTRGELAHVTRISSLGEPFSVAGPRIEPATNGHYE